MTEGCLTISTNFTDFEKEEGRESSEESKDSPQGIDPDWDAEAGLTGAFEGSPEDVKRLKPIQYRAISLLLQGKTQSYVASELGVTRRSVSNWMEVGSLVREIYMRRKHDLWEASMQQVSRIYEKAIRVTEDALDSPDEKIRLRAASMVLKNLCLSEPFDPNNIPSAYRDYYKERKEFGGQYYSCMKTGRLENRYNNPDIPWTSSEHLEECTYDARTTPENPSFVLQPEEIVVFAEELESRGVSCTKVQDVVYPCDLKGKRIASIFSIRAEQQSVFHWEDITASNRRTVARSIVLPKSRHLRLDYYHPNRVIIPAKVSRQVLVDILCHLVFHPYEVREIVVSDEEASSQDSACTSAS